MYSECVKKIDVERNKDTDTCYLDIKMINRSEGEAIVLTVVYTFLIHLR